MILVAAPANGRQEYALTVKVKNGMIDFLRVAGTDFGLGWSRGQAPRGGINYT